MVVQRTRGGGWRGIVSGAPYRPRRAAHNAARLVYNCEPMGGGLLTKIFIATPMYGGMCCGLYTQSMLGLQGIFAQMQIQSLYSVMFNESLIPRGRNAMTKAFLKSDATHLFFIDSDI